MRTCVKIDKYINVKDHWSTGGSCEMIVDIAGIENVSNWHIVFNKTNNFKISWVSGVTQQNDDNCCVWYPETWNKQVKSKLVIEFGIETVNMTSDFDLSFGFYYNNESSEARGESAIQYKPQEDFKIDGIPNDVVYGIYDVGTTLHINFDGVVEVNNPNVCDVDNSMNVCVVSEGTCSVKFTKPSGEFRLFGIYTKNYHKIKKMKFGSVSEHDPLNGMRFWSDFSKQRYCEISYIYLNGGPQDYGWRMNYTDSINNTEPEGKRAINFLLNSLRLGMETCFVYYNIPSGGESYWTNRQNYENEQYILDYFKDLTFLLDVINKYCPDIRTWLILEPDMLSYILQNEKFNTPDDVFVNLPGQIKTLPEFIKQMNTLIKGTCPQVEFCHKINLWGSLTSDNPIPGGKGLIPVTDTVGHQPGLKIIEDNAMRIAQFYKDCGILSGNPNFIAFDRYGLDGALVTEKDKIIPSESQWFWNHDHWMNYIYFTRRVSEILKLKTILWQLPCGYINNAKDYPDLKGEDGAPVFFFGHTFTREDTRSFNYFKKNEWNDLELKYTNDSKEIIWPNKMDYSWLNRIRIIMFGAGVGASTTNLYMAQTGGVATDNEFCMNKFKENYFF